MLRSFFACPDLRVMVDKRDFRCWSRVFVIWVSTFCPFPPLWRRGVAIDGGFVVPLSVSFLLPFLGWAFPGVLRGGFVCSICVFIPPLGCIARVVGFFVFGCVVCLFL